MNAHPSSKQLLMHVNVLNRDIAVVEIVLIHDAAVERNQMLYARDHRFIQRRFHAANGVFTVSAPHQEFRQQGVEASWHLVAWMGMRVAANTEATREMAFPQAARAWNKFTRVLSVQAALD
jgi:hypothetical protein